jgi:hypothetical protein
VAELEALVLALGETLLVVALVVDATAVIMEPVLLLSAMLAVTIVAVVASSIRPLTPALVSKTLQFSFIAHALWRLMPLQQ